MLPKIQLLPLGEIAPAEFSPGFAFIHHSTVRSVAPTLTGYPGTSRILTLSMSLTPLPWKRSEKPPAAAGNEPLASRHAVRATTSRLRGRPILPQTEQGLCPGSRAPSAPCDRRGGGRRSRIVRPITETPFRWYEPLGSSKRTRLRPRAPPEMAPYETRYRPRFVRPVLPRSGFQRSPTFASRARKLSKRQSSMSTPRSTSFQETGVDTGARARGRTE
jgi:hypothetical protein